jgi:hypothetical protein
VWVTSASAGWARQRAVVGLHDLRMLSIPTSEAASPIHALFQATFRLCSMSSSIRINRLKSASPSSSW